MIYGLYVATVLGALALLMMMPRQGYSPHHLGALLGASVLGGLWLFLATFIDGGPSSERVYYYIFSALAIASAVKVITHRRPVFAALWFIMVVLATAGLLLILHAEFMAFAMIIIYGGAILVTYVFVIMLATQAVAESEAPTYDRVAHEPLAALAAGFLLLAVLLSVMFQPLSANPRAAEDPNLTVLQLPNRPVSAAVANLSAEQQSQMAPLLDDSTAHNSELIGVDLFKNHPLGLELAGIILLISLVGAVVIARQRVEQEKA